MAKFNDTDIKKGASAMTLEDVKKAGERGDAVINLVKKGPISQFLEDVKTMVSLVKDYGSGKYKAIPWWAISAVAFALLYVFSPIDAIPDVLPVVGQLDDALVVAACIKLIHEELAKYRSWKATSGDN